MLPPVIVGPDDSSASARVGDVVVFSVAEPDRVTVTAEPDGVLDLAQGGPQGDAMMNPGGRAVAAGSVTVTLAGPHGVRAVMVTVSA